MPPLAGALADVALSNPPGALDLSVVNGEAWRTAEIPAVNGHGTADAIARFYAGLLAVASSTAYGSSPPRRSAR